MKILLACQTATNKGDRAIAEYVMSELLEQGHEVVLSTTRPDLWQNMKSEKISVIGMGYKSVYRHSKSKIVRKFLRALSRFVCDKLLFWSLISPKGKHALCRYVSGDFVSEVKSADLVIVTGGHHITSIREKNALFQFTYDIGLISLYAKRYVLWSQTIGPLNFTTKKARNFIGNVIRKAEKVYIRDENSIACVRELYGNCDNLIKTHDSVFGYGIMEFPDIIAREKKIGISIFDGLKKAFSTYGALAKVLDEYAAKGYIVEFFRMEHNDYEMESIRRIVSLMRYNDNVRVHPFMTTTEEHLKEVASCQCFIGYKTHSVIMALATATPLAAIAYHEKTMDFMRTYGLGEYAIFDEELDYEKLQKCMRNVSENAEMIHEKQKTFSQMIAQTVKKDLYEMVNNEYPNT